MVGEKNACALAFVVINPLLPNKLRFCNGYAMQWTCARLSTRVCRLYGSFRPSGRFAASQTMTNRQCRRRQAEVCLDRMTHRRPVRRRTTLVAAISLDRQVSR